MASKKLLVAIALGLLAVLVVPSCAQKSQNLVPSSATVWMGGRGEIYRDLYHGQVEVLSTDHESFQDFICIQKKDAVDLFTGGSE